MIASRAAARFFCTVAALLIALAALWSPSPVHGRVDAVAAPTVALSTLPPEARQTVLLIRRGGPFPFERDGVAFGNFERRLPLHERGYYREYTVPTPGVKHRGARRIVSGRSGELYYSDDHYQSFRRIRE